VLLLRASVAALRAAGHRVSVLAPSAAGAALVGPGPGEAESALPWEAASMASLLSGDGQLPDEARRVLAPFDGVIAYTSNEELVRGIAAAAPRAQVVSRGPLPPTSGPHAARWLAEAVRPFGADPNTPTPLLQPTADEIGCSRTWLDRLGARFLAIHPGSGSAGKNWPADRFTSVVDAVAAGQPWLLVEGPADRDAAVPLARRDGAVRARELPARVLGTVLARAGVYVGNDSGVSHLAAAWGAPVVALFGPTDPALWAPVGPRVTVVRSPDGRMDGIAATHVTDAALERREAAGLEIV
jgi:hypothetical protein